ncbi:hypothetical protein D3C85_1194050 [compost metagenome]
MPAAVRDPVDRGIHLSLFRRHGLEWQLRCAGLVAGTVRCAFSRFCRFSGGACHGRVAGVDRRIAVGAAQRALSRRALGCLCTLQYSVSGVGVVDPDRWLVRLQRDECANLARRQRPGGSQLVDGDGRWYGRSVAGWAQRPGIPAQRPAGRFGGGLRGLGPDAPDRRPGDRGHRRDVVRLVLHRRAKSLEDR